MTTNSIMRMTCKWDYTGKLLGINGIKLIWSYPHRSLGQPRVKQDELNKSETRISRFTYPECLGTLGGIYDRNTKQR
jgi:hypothetical protein